MFSWHRCDPSIKCIVKYRNHPSILVIREVYSRTKKPSFSFSDIDKKEILLEICNLNSSKVSQDTDIPTKIIKINVDIFTDFIHSAFNISLKVRFFHFLKKLDEKILVFNPLTTNVPNHIETSQLFSNANQLTGFYMTGNIGR